MTLKLSVPQLTDVQICALKFVPNGLIAGSSDGRVYLYERDGGLQRQFNDHYKSGKITQIDYDGGLDHFQHLTLGGDLWLTRKDICLDFGLGEEGKTPFSRLDQLQIR